MGTYILGRVVQAMVVLVLDSVLLFLVLRMLTGDNPCYTVSAQCQNSTQLTVPVVDQYVYWLRGIVHGDPESSGIAQRLPATVLLLVISYTLQQLLALPLGILAAVRQYSIVDQVFTILSYVALSLPAFVIGITLIWIFPVTFG